ncbi:hypothetical protein SAMN05444161_5843 [Rhizobiales bacterium GAS191]|nr:hypothetical protein SAMN05444161_5843 [Rhizobiales bacterium GAS191]
MTPDQYLQQILTREAVDVGPYSPVRGCQSILMPMLQLWANRFLLNVTPSGSFAKGTANLSGTDIDLFISLHPDTPETLKQIYNSLATRLREVGYQPRLQNVSVGIQVGAYRVDLVPGKIQNALMQDHSLYRRKADTWTKTNIGTHIAKVRASGRQSEIRVIKLWRDQNGLEFPSLYLELTVIAALKNIQSNAAAVLLGSSISGNVWKVFGYLASSFETTRVVDPSNTNNILSDDITAKDRTAIKSAATLALAKRTWGEIVI